MTSTTVTNYVKVLDLTTHDHMLVPFCCEGKVICRVVYEYKAHANMLEGQEYKGHTWHCAKCGRELPAHPEPPRKPLAISRKR
jgi:hypothetical protein